MGNLTPLAVQIWLQSNVWKENCGNFVKWEISSKSSSSVYEKSGGTK